MWWHHGLLRWKLVFPDATDATLISRFHCLGCHHAADTVVSLRFHYRCYIYVASLNNRLEERDYYFLPNEDINTKE